MAPDQIFNVPTDEKVEVVAIPEMTNNKPKPLDKTDEEKADEADSNARLAEAMKLQAEMQEAKLQALKVANKSRQTAAIQVRQKHCQKWDSNPRLQWRPETSLTLIKCKLSA